MRREWSVCRELCHRTWSLLDGQFRGISWRGAGGGGCGAGGGRTLRTQGVAAVASPGSYWHSLTHSGCRVKSLQALSDAPRAVVQASGSPGPESPTDTTPVGQLQDA